MRARRLGASLPGSLRNPPRRRDRQPGDRTAGIPHRGAADVVFASLTFLYLFLPVTFALYFLVPNQSYRNAILIVSSLFFYAWGEPIWISLMIFTTVVDYVSARAIERWRGSPWAKVALVGSLVSNLGLLAIFKYLGFFGKTINFLTSVSLNLPSFSLPIGISFYTFQSISYIIDVYRGEVQAQRSFFKYLLFVSLFHQLVAGPIVRYVHIANEIDNRTHSVAEISRGVTRFCLGLFKKVCIANVAGELVARYMDADPGMLSVGESWFGLLMFTLQIFFDFAGYSDMAIGLGLMFGFHYHENFNYPYTARSATDFWRRWHISLSTFFRDYVYIPLGGKYDHPYRNLLVVWFLTGLWHGASWNFVLWGVYYGVLIMTERLFLSRVLQALPRVFQHIYLCLAVMLGWSLFYFTDLGKLAGYLTVMFGGRDAPLIGDLGLVVGEHAFWLLVSLALCLPIYPTATRLAHEWLERAGWRQTSASLAVASANFGLLLLATAMLVGRSYNPFLYFRF